MNGIVREASQNLVQLLNEILDGQKLEEGKVVARLEPTDIASKIQGAIDVFSASAQSKSLALTLQVSPSVSQRYLTDGMFIRQIVSNLVSNALKFTKIGGVTVSVDARQHAEQGDLLHDISITVRDTGDGMRQDEVANLFMPYMQGESGRQSATGTGLGLSICATLANALGGRIWAESTVGQGAIFTVHFSAEAVPIDENDTLTAIKTIDKNTKVTSPQTDAMVASPQASTVNAGLRRQVLACEDDPLIQALLKEQFAELDVDADIVADASLGLAYIRARRVAGTRYDIIFTDNSMGGMSGIEFARTMRADEKAFVLAPTPIVGITGSIMLGEQQQCIEAGMDQVMCKPVVLADLKRAMDELIPKY